jgi:hypothetical protein
MNRMSSARFLTIAAVAYLLVMAGVLLGLMRARQWTIAVYGSPSAETQWQSFRQDVARQAERRAPVSRREPKSEEPPALVLMRDYFGVCALIAVGLTSALFGTLAFFVGGVLSQARRE